MPQRVKGDGGVGEENSHLNNTEDSFCVVS